MNNLEIKMLETLKSLKEDFGVTAVKAEFEAEGTRIDELLRLVEIIRKLNLNLGIKIGGCEAIKDLMECKQIGVDYIIAPMVETPYALKKFIEAKNKIYQKEELERTDFLINIETHTSVKNIDKMIKINNLSKNPISGFVFGRVDYTLSCGLSRDQINRSSKVTNSVLNISKKAKKNNLDLVVGGAVSVDALNVLKKINKIHLTRFETRKIIFDNSSLEHNDISKGLLKAVSFELLWLKNKKNYYGEIFKEDDKRISMLSKRWKF